MKRERGEREEVGGGGGGGGGGVGFDGAQSQRIWIFCP